MLSNINNEIKYLKDNYKVIFFIALVSYLFAYGFELTHFTLSIDEEYLDNFAGTVSFGRWGHALLREYILPEPYIPFFTTAISIVSLSLCATLSARLIGLQGVPAICFAMLIVGIPQVAYQMSFSNQSDTVSIAFLFSAIAVYFTRNLSKLGFVSLSVILVIPASIYQSVLFYAVSLLLLSLLFNVIYKDYSFRDVAYRLLFMFFALVVAVIINSIMARFIQSFYGIASSDYLTNMITWGKKDTEYLVIQLYRMVIRSLTFNNYTGLNGFSLSILSCVLLAIYTLKCKSKPIIAFLVVGSLISPFFLPFLTGTELSPRTSTQLPLIFAGLSAIVITLSGVTLLPLALSVIVLICGASVSNRLFYSDYMARKSDVMNAERMMTIAHLKFPEFDYKRNPVFFYGAFTPVNNWNIDKTNVFGASFFDWDGGNNRRIYAFFSVTNIANMRKPDNDQKNKSIAYAKDKPAWPSSEAVMMNDGVLIIKLGDKLNRYNW